MVAPDVLMKATSMSREIPSENPHIAILGPRIAILIGVSVDHPVWFACWFLLMGFVDSGPCHIQLYLGASQLSWEWRMSESPHWSIPYPACSRYKVTLLLIQTRDMWPSEGNPWLSYVKRQDTSYQGLVIFWEHYLHDQFPTCLYQ